MRNPIRPALALSACLLALAPGVARSDIMIFTNESMYRDALEQQGFKDGNLIFEDDFGGVVTGRDPVTGFEIKSQIPGGVVESFVGDSGLTTGVRARSGTFTELVESVAGSDPQNRVCWNAESFLLSSDAGGPVTITARGTTGDVATATVTVPPAGSAPNDTAFVGILAILGQCIGEVQIGSATSTTPLTQKTNIRVSMSPIPEPSALALAGVGLSLCTLASWVRRRRR